MLAVRCLHLSSILCRFRRISRTTSTFCQAGFRIGPNGRTGTPNPVPYVLLYEGPPSIRSKHPWVRKEGSHINVVGSIIRCGCLPTPPLLPTNFAFEIVPRSVKLPHSCSLPASRPRGHSQIDKHTAQESGSQTRIRARFLPRTP